MLPEGNVPLCMLMAAGPSSVRTSTCTGGPTCPRRTISSLDTHVDAKGLSSPLSRALAETQSGSWQTADLGFALSLSPSLVSIGTFYLYVSVTSLEEESQDFPSCVFSSMMPTEVITTVKPKG